MPTYENMLFGLSKGKVGGGDIKEKYKLKI
jgi:hypothetical protein